MYKIEKREFGFKLYFSGVIQADEMRRWLEESEKVLADTCGIFCVFVDMRGLQVLPPSSQEFMKQGQQLYKRKGMVRSVVITDTDVNRLQFVHIARKTGICEGERYIDAATEPNWEEVGLDWILEGIEPPVSVPAVLRKT